jgi:hypothetical protein
MRIRSITSFFDPGLPDARTTLRLLAKISATLKKEISDQHFPVLPPALLQFPFRIL